MINVDERELAFGVTLKVRAIICVVIASSGRQASRLKRRRKVDVSTQVDDGKFTCGAAALCSQVIALIVTRSDLHRE